MTPITWYYWTNGTASTNANANATWGYWTASGSTSTSNLVTYNTGAWQHWNEIGTTSSAATMYLPQARAVDPYANETPEEREARLERWRIEQEKSVRRQRRLHKRQKIAALRARRLLEAALTDEQSEEYERTKAFTMKVRDPRDRTFRTFRVNHGIAGNVTEIDEHGRRMRKFCIHPRGSLGVPTEDVMLAQKLMLETDLESFERIANVST